MHSIASKKGSSRLVVIIQSIVAGWLAWRRVCKAFNVCQCRQTRNQKRGKRENKGEKANPIQYKKGQEEMGILPYRAIDVVVLLVKRGPAHAGYQRNSGRSSHTLNKTRPTHGQARINPKRKHFHNAVDEMAIDARRQRHATHDSIPSCPSSLSKQTQ